MAQAVQVPATERQCAEILGDGVEQTASGRYPQRYVGSVGLFGVVGCFHLNDPDQPNLGIEQFCEEVYPTSS